MRHTDVNHDVQLRVAAMCVTFIISSRQLLALLSFKLCSDARTVLLYEQLTHHRTNSS